MANSTRIGGVDFARGLVLVAIMIDHVPGDVLENLTPRNFALCDSAEAFVFLSGVSVGLAYYRRSLASGLLPVARRCLARAGRIYGVHLGLTIGAAAIFGLGYCLSGQTALIEDHGRDVVFHRPAEGAVGVALLTHQLGYFNILPLYVALMAGAPLILAAARASALFALTAAGGAYFVVRLLDLHLPNWPEPGGWFFNPLAWQFVFALGVVAAIRWRDASPPLSPALRAACFALAAAGAIVTTQGFGLLPGLRDPVFAALDAGKQNLGAARLVNFLALAYLAATSPRLAQLARTRPGLALQRLGRHSLAVFALVSLLSAVGQVAVSASTSHASTGIAKAIGFGYTLASIGALFALARYLEWRRSLLGDAAEGGAAAVAEAPRRSAPSLLPSAP